MIQKEAARRYNHSTVAGQGLLSKTGWDQSIAMVVSEIAILAMSGLSKA